MRFRFLISLVLIVFLSGVTFAARSTKRLQSRESASIKITVNQPPEKAGVMPVEIIQPSFVSSAPNKLDDLTYSLRNNSTKAVIAAAVIKTIAYEDDGKTERDSVYCTMDTAFHPDMRGKSLLPGTQMTMESPGPLSFSGSVAIKEITLTLDYAVFDDNSSYGAGGEGERIITGVREGARQYKNWLVQEYSRNGKSLTAIFSLIQADNIPEGLKLDANQTVGAQRYRLQLLSTFRKKGAAEVESYLNQKQ